MAKRYFISGVLPELRESFGLRLAELNRFADALMANLAALCGEWENIHGDY